ncbi:hypothetical protein [Paenibacillus sp. SYP-B4298]|nr:hypothetical protein [Paenibacillus sp. SYP-B4298]
MQMGENGRNRQSVTAHGAQLRGEAITAGRKARQQIFQAAHGFGILE